jgi:hypothetical protein
MVRLQPDQLAAVNEWRLQQPDQPSAPEALRRLAEIGLALLRVHETRR